MAQIPIPLGPASDKARQHQGGGAVLTNCYVERTEGGKTGYSINTRPRLKLFSDIEGGGPCRGAVAIGSNVLYVVSGEGLFKVGSGGGAVRIGTVMGQLPVIMTVNRKAPNKQIAITADTHNYVVENDVVSEVTDLDLPSGVHSNCYINGRTVYGIADGTFYLSAENDSGSVNALDFAEAERESDEGVRVFSWGEDFWYFGTRSLEIFRTTGDAFPFAPLLGAGRSDGGGCAAKYSVSGASDMVVWVNDYFNVVASSGGQPQRISTHEVDRDIARAMALGLKDEITGFSYDVEGHLFYYLRCPLWCWKHDFATGFWFKVTSYLSDTFRCGHYVSAFSKDLLLDVTEGKIYEYSLSTRDDAGEPCVMAIETGPVAAFPDGYVCNSLKLDVMRGVGVATEDDHAKDPKIILSVSRDGGMTWGREYLNSAGMQGKYSAEVRFNRLGSCSGAGMAFKISMPEPVERAVFQAVADVSPLRN